MVSDSDQNLIIYTGKICEKISIFSGKISKNKSFETKTKINALNIDLFRFSETLNLLFIA